MATCLNGTTSSLQRKMFTKLTITDVLCPVCRGIFIEPVTLPCHHGLCLQCLEPTMEETSLTCPMCRKRIGSWLRSATKDRRLVNDKLWAFIKRRFPHQVQAKLSGDDDDIEPDLGRPPSLSTPGALRREYELEVKRLEEETRKQKEKEEQASEAYIRKLHEEECKRLEEEKKLQLTIAATDEEVARQLLLSEQAIARIDTNASTEGGGGKNIPNKPVTVKGPLDAYFSHGTGSGGKAGGSTKLSSVRVEKARSLSNISSESHDSINQEMHHFKPIKIAPRTPPKRLADGRVVEPKLIKAIPRNLNEVYDAMCVKDGSRKSTSSQLLVDLVIQDRLHNLWKIGADSVGAGAYSSSQFTSAFKGKRQHSSEVNELQSTQVSKKRLLVDKGACSHTVTATEVAATKGCSRKKAPNSIASQKQGSSTKSKTDKTKCNKKCSQSGLCLAIVSKAGAEDKEVQSEGVKKFFSKDCVKDTPMRPSYSRDTSDMTVVGGNHTAVKREENTKESGGREEAVHRRCKLNNNTIGLDGLLVSEQAHIEQLIQQEREDWEFACRLEEEWSKADRNVDRRKGSERAYELRNTRRQQTLEESFGGRLKGGHK